MGCRVSIRVTKKGTLESAEEGEGERERDRRVETKKFWVRPTRERKRMLIRLGKKKRKRKEDDLCDPGETLGPWAILIFCGFKEKKRLESLSCQRGGGKEGREFRLWKANVA